MSRSYDVIVIGAGHNGLTAAALLGRSGRRVLVCERDAGPGGLAAGWEFHPGYRSAGVFHESGGVRDAVVRALDLARHGLASRTRRPDVLALGDAGETLLLRGDPAQAIAELRACRPSEAPRYARFREFCDRVRGTVRRLLDAPPPDLIDPAGDLWVIAKQALGLRGLGARTMLELLRVPPMPVADWIEEWFDDDLLAAALVQPAVAGTFAGPRSPGTAANLLLAECAAGPGVHRGGPALVSALEAAARTSGVELRYSTTVERVHVADGAVRGVTAGGESIETTTVAASCDPKQLFCRLLEPDAAPVDVERHVEGLRCRGTMAHALIALEGRIEYSGRPGERIGLARTGSRIDAIERAFDPIKYRALPSTPVLEIHVPTIEDPGLAPDGCDVLSVHVHFVPHDLARGWNEDARACLLDTVLETIETHAPGTRARVAGRVLLAPPDIERRYGCTGGQIHHVEPSLDQLLVRPAPRCTGFTTPIEGLVLCGSGSHPGGGLTGAPGALAASVLTGRRVL